MSATDCVSAPHHRKNQVKAAPPMSVSLHHANQQAILAAVLATHSEAISRCGQGIARYASQRFWIASKSRQARWAAEFKSLERARHGYSELLRVRHWQRVQALTEEVLTSDILTRVWFAVGQQIDRRADEAELEPFLRSVFHGHQESRTRSLRLIAQRAGIGDKQAAELDRMNKHCERWSDLLLAAVAPWDPPARVCFNFERTSDFAQSFRNPNDPARALMIASATAAFTAAHALPVSPGLNQQICQAILSSLRPEVFDSTGLFKSIWLVRLQHTTEDVEDSIANLLNDLSASSATRRYFSPDR